MNRREFAASMLAAGIAVPLAGCAVQKGEKTSLPHRPLTPPDDGLIRTAFAIGPGVNVIDLAGPWESFQDAAVDRAARAQFQLYTVAETPDQLEASGGLQLTPTYTYESAPQPNVVVIPAHGSTDATVRWIRRAAERADLVMSVCTGAFVLAQTGLLDGKTATTHHGFWDDFETTFPKVRLLRGPRFVEHDHVATAGGLTSGIDLALRVVERFLGTATALATAEYMEHTRIQA
jgi:transcriptional regulator GlxA family with amidase domain